MTDCVWEPLAELELNSNGSNSYQIYCLCSRAFIRNKNKFYDEDEIFKENLEECEVDNDPVISVCNPEGHNIQLETSKKLEAEAASCYCSASHYSTDDYESVMQSTSDNQHINKDQLVFCPLQNSDSGADLSENFVEKSVNINVDDPYAKSKLHILWEKYWSENGENIIWKSWLEKYGAYINPNYLEQNSLGENFDMELNNIIKDSNTVDSNEDCAKLTNIDISTEKEENFKETIERIPCLKISSYASCTNLSELGETAKTNIGVEDLDVEDKILKSNSFGSYASYEKVKSVSVDDDKLKHNDHERVRSRCSNTNLSVKSIANTTVTTDSMTNVTKITLSSLDLSCDYESVRSSSLLSTSSEDSSGPSSTSSSSSKEDMCTEADLWWKKVWKEHYEDQYTSSYKAFAENFFQSSEIVEAKTNALEEAKSELIKKINEKIETSQCNNVFNSRQYLNSVGYTLQQLDNTNLELEQNERDDMEIKEGDSNCRQELLKNKRFRKKGKSVKKMDNINHAMALMGYSFKGDPNEVLSGYVKYRKKNIRVQNRKLKLPDTKPRTHIFFDDDGNPCEWKCAKYDDIVEPEPKVSEKLEEEEEEEEDEETKVVEENFVEPESLGYEAHSSSVEDCDDVIHSSKRQRKRRKKQRKCSGLPQEILDNKRLIKYWYRRYELFSKFDLGIKLDTESWYSVTPEKLAMHHAERCRCDVIVDAFCGAGGNSIQFAFTCERVIAIDVDPNKIEIAKHNAQIYGVDDRIEFIVGDFINLADNLQADVVFLSPPWGGPQYSSHEVFSLNNILHPLGGEGLFRLASRITGDVAFFLPKNCDTTALTLVSGPGGEVEIEQNFIDQRLRSITAYFGGLVMDPE